MANTNIKSGAVLGVGGPSIGMGGGGAHAARHNATDNASVGSTVTFDTFDDSFASFKDLNKSCFVPGADLEDSVYDTSVASAKKKPDSKKKAKPGVQKQQTQKKNKKVATVKS